MDDRPLYDRAMFWVAVAGVVGLLGGIPLAIALARDIPAQVDLWSDRLFLVGTGAIALAGLALWWAITLNVAHGHAATHWCPDPAAHRHSSVPAYEPPRPVPTRPAEPLGQRIIALDPPPPTKDPPVSQGRVYVRVTTAYFVGLYNTHTSMEADRLMADFKDKWIRVTGLVSNVYEHAGGVRYIQLDEPGYDHFLGLTFRGLAAASVVGLGRKDEITVEGQISTADIAKVDLENCELVASVT